ncbi:hypothetical protein WOLCODRAFT_161375 [Wolfiporia cocos MD-104 SS10]|uniref:Uncharacterized protein n=1 Tax=Wolfiporia cocos (strain MD-104) TaxID=742152 RepID=A0A2H3J7I1_WOLCO|nr:hypothetical protein WOLCODRAFT_161375 [Wolfiporia cocos MD-104 SS10]
MPGFCALCSRMSKISDCRGAGKDGRAALRYKAGRAGAWADGQALADSLCRLATTATDSLAVQPRSPSSIPVLLPPPTSRAPSVSFALPADPRADPPQMCHRQLRFYRAAACGHLTFTGDTYIDCKARDCAHSALHPPDCGTPPAVCRCRRYYTCVCPPVRVPA